MWAEDGKIFYADALDHSYLGVLFRAYNGYFQLVPRTEAEVVTWFPIADASDVLAICAAATVAALALVVFRASAGHLPSPWLRGFLALAMVLLPIATQETLNNLANLHWYFMVATFWVLLWQPPSRVGAAVALVVVVLAVGSDPLTALLIPLVVLRLVGFNRRTDHVLALGFLGACAVQAAVVIGAHGRTFAASLPTIREFGRSYSIRVALQSVAGKSGTETLYSAWGRGAVALALVVLLVALVAAVARQGTSAWLAVAASAASVLFYFATALVSWTSAWLPQPRGLFLFVYSRYAVLPILFVLTVLLVASSITAKGKVACAVVILTITGLAIPLVVDFRTPSARSAGPAWSQQVRNARAFCAGKSDEARVTIAISPRPWQADVACVHLR